MNANEASSGMSALDDGLERLRVAAGIELEDSFEAGSKWCVGDDEFAALVALAKAEERAACADLADELSDCSGAFIAERIRERSNAHYG